ncbi:MAG TPA: acetaldehyde dehydrogenase (acetylating) [Candidatus Pelethocola excrementipullorum]|nr:acetaldehyde dehydrogenase (acetylating) [Candidatus Pelethocola excrementipullorum]
MEMYDKDLQSIQEARNLAELGKKAADILADFNEEQIDRIIKNMVEAAEEHARELAEMAVEETGFGIVDDKVYKNHLASGLLYEDIKDMKTIGIIEEDKQRKTVQIADPMGLIMGIVPSTNPTSTCIYKSIISVKSRNAIVFSPHPAAKKCTLRAAELMQKAAKEAGAPENTIGCLKTLSMSATNELMKHKNVALIIATGGPGLVKAAYSSGKPAIGVGAGNSPAYIEKSANVKDAVERILTSKTFDHGTVCASEQSIIAERSNREEVISELKRQGGYFMSKDETDRVCQLLFKNGHTMNAQFVAKNPQTIADAAGIKIPADTRVLIGEQEGVGEGYPLSFEKLTTVLAFYTVQDSKEAYKRSEELLQNGIGHTMSLHTESEEIALKFASLPASRILVNTGGTQGATGASTSLSPAFTLGCGTWGGSSVSENVTPLHLINKKMMAYGLRDVTKLADEDQMFHSYQDGKQPSRASGLPLSAEDLKTVIDEIMKAVGQKS